MGLRNMSSTIGKEFNLFYYVQQSYGFIVKKLPQFIPIPRINSYRKVLTKTRIPNAE